MFVVVVNSNITIWDGSHGSSLFYLIIQYFSRTIVINYNRIRGAWEAALLNYGIIIPTTGKKQSVYPVFAN